MQAQSTRPWGLGCAFFLPGGDIEKRNFFGRNSQSPSVHLKQSIAMARLHMKAGTGRLQPLTFVSFVRFISRCQIVQGEVIKY
jgi:hypothetical protein